ncbi:molybdopterin biosynthesis protein MoeB [Macrococcus equipercicus]|uniref:Molybdopterin biosynthesis protein MoeB n=1 Tax=Macrococcus equipercicus TaxID=69967 RepID=A0ABQ6R905_9STAP|nr:ThiF family adenylyltransferase [Macrococcus equipercicus]KAA1039627.1 molybdopterin biosynthesis protein MoeB [Macrococcus equipercicus]
MNRYDRQEKFNHIGRAGQSRINTKTVGIIGMGALGTHTASTLVRAGVKRLIIIDRDYVELSNLQRQTLFVERDAVESLPKVIAAKKQLEQIDSEVMITAHIDHCDAAALHDYFASCDLLIDGTDNFEVRQTINDFSYKTTIPWIYGACVEATYAACAFIPGVTPCFNCALGSLPVMNRTCDTVGIIEPAVSLAASFQSVYAMKILTGIPFDAKLIYGDVWNNDHTTLKFGRTKKPDCVTCGVHPTFPYLADTQQETMLCGRNTVQFRRVTDNAAELERFLSDRDMNYQKTPYFIRFQFNEKPMMWFPGGRLLIHDIKSINEAKTVFHQLFG